MWYKVYLPSYFSGNEVAVRILVTDGKGTKKDSYFIQSEGKNYLENYYRFPFDMASGIYQFHFITFTKITEREISLTRFEVPFYNDPAPIDKQKAAPATLPVNTGSAIVNSNLQLHISTDKEVYAQGADIQLGLSITDASGARQAAYYSISVVDEEMIGSHWIGNTISQTSTSHVNKDVLHYLDNSVYVRGQVADADGQPKRLKQLGVYDGQNNNMFLVATNDNGDFFVFLPEMYGNRHLQFAGYISNEIQDISVELNSDKQRKAATRLVYDENVLGYIELGRKRKKIYQNFKALEYDLEYAKVENELRNVKPDKVYDISKYVSFVSVGAFFDEIISAPLSFSQNGEKITARMFDPEAYRRANRGRNASENFPLDPVFIIDGKMTRNANHVYSMDLNGVTTIEIYNSRPAISQLFGNFRNYGVVKINTSLPDVTIPAADQEDIHAFNGIQPKASYYNMKSLKADIPNLRPLAYWNPDVTSDGQQDALLTFPATEDASTFRIVVVGQTAKGDIVKGAKTFRTVLANRP